MTHQERARRAAGSAADAAARECDALLAGITVPPDLREQALALVLADSFSRRDLVRAFPGRSSEQGAMLRRRNAAIRALLTTDAQRSTYDANSDALEGRRARGEDIHPAAPTTPET